MNSKSCALTGTKFGTQVENYTHGRKPYPSEIFTWIQEASPLSAKVLDLECGNARSTLKLYEIVSTDVTGFDFDEEMLAEARKNSKAKNYEIPFYQGSVENLAEIFKPRQFQIITAFTAFHWFSGPKYIEAMHAVLDKLGIVVIVGGPDGAGETGEFHRECIKIVSESAGRHLSHKEISQNAKKYLEINQLFKVIEGKDFYILDTYTQEELFAKIKSHSFYTELSSSEKDIAWPLLEEFANSKLQNNSVSFTTYYKATLAKPC